MGVRTCIGQHFALLEARAWIAAVYTHFTFTLPPGFQFMISHKEGGAAPSLQGLELQVDTGQGQAGLVGRVREARGWWVGADRAGGWQFRAHGQVQGGWGQGHKLHVGRGACKEG